MSKLDKCLQSLEALVVRTIRYSFGRPEKSWVGTRQMRGCEHTTLVTEWESEDPESFLV